MLSHSFFRAHPAVFFAFYRERMIAPDAQPNQAHIKLAELERAGRLASVVTQKHRRPASGGGFKARVGAARLGATANVCQKCGAVYDAAWILRARARKTK